jgi:hypothetical protein
MLFSPLSSWLSLSRSFSLSFILFNKEARSQTAFTLAVIVVSLTVAQASV